MRFRYSRKNATADAFSHLPCPVLKEDFIIRSESACAVDDFQGLPMTAKQIALTGHKQDGCRNAQMPILALTSTENGSYQSHKIAYCGDVE